MLKRHTAYAQGKQGKPVFGLNPAKRIAILINRYVRNTHQKDERFDLGY